jgi:hypothetical protein
VSIPNSVTQILVTLVLVVPGFVFQGVRIRLRGRTPGDTEVATRILSAIVVSTIFALVYILVLGSSIVEPEQLQDDALRHPRGYALLGLAAAFVVPVLAAYFFAGIASSDRGERLRQRLLSHRWTNIDPRPSAWDAAFGDIGECFVRVRTREKTWYAGWFGGDSYASSWPDPQTLFVEVAYKIDASGKIGDPVESSTGAFIDCTDADYIEFLTSPDQDASGTIGTTEVS